MKRTDRVRICSVAAEAVGWHSLSRYIFEYRRRDGTWQRLERDACFRDDSAAVLLLIPMRRSVLLTRQFRLPMFLRENDDGFMWELPGGLLGGDSPLQAAMRETEQEVGRVPTTIKKVLSVCMSPMLLVDRTHLFVACLAGNESTSFATGIEAEGEDIQVCEVQFDDAFAMIDSGDILDAKTILLLYYAKLYKLLDSCETIERE